MAEDAAGSRPSYRVATDVVSRGVRDETVLLNLESEEYFGLDPIGTRMWQVIEETGDPEEVIRRLLGAYDVEESVLRQDLADLIERLEKAGLLSSDGDD